MSSPRKKWLVLALAGIVSGIAFWVASLFLPQGLNALDFLDFPVGVATVAGGAVLLIGDYVLKR